MQKSATRLDIESKRIQTASHWGAYTVAVDRNGHVGEWQRLVYDANPSALCAGLPELVRSPLRIQKPVVRESYLRDREKSRANRGSDRFIEVSWDQALSLIQNEISRIRTTYGDESIYGGSYGWASAGRLHHSPSVLKRFLGLGGGYVDKLGNHSFGAALHIAPYVIGRGDIPHMGMSWPLIIENTKVMVLFGGAPAKNTQIDSAAQCTIPGLVFARAGKADRSHQCQSGADDIHPNIAATGPAAAEYRRRADAGIAHTLVSESLHDTAFLETPCVGFPQLKTT